MFKMSCMRRYKSALEVIGNSTVLEIGQISGRKDFSERRSPRDMFKMLIFENPQPPDDVDLL